MIASNLKLQELNSGIYVQNSDVNEDFKAVFRLADTDPELSSTISQNKELNAWWADQRRALTTQGMRGMRWNHAVLRVALSTYLRGPAAYKALKETGVVKLPSGRLLQSYICNRAQAVGLDEHNGHLLQEAYRLHTLAKSKATTTPTTASTTANLPLVHRSDFKPYVSQPPAGLGAVMFDEIKISGDFAFKNNSEFIGFATSAEDLVSLRNLYVDDSRETSKVEAPSPCSYVLQFMWRDMTSHFDVIGPYRSMLEPAFIAKLVASSDDAFSVKHVKTVIFPGAQQRVSQLTLPR